MSQRSGNSLLGRVFVIRADEGLGLGVSMIEVVVGEVLVEVKVAVGVPTLNRSQVDQITQDSKPLADRGHCSSLESLRVDPVNSVSMYNLEITTMGH